MPLIIVATGWTLRGEEYAPRRNDAGEETVAEVVMARQPDHTVGKPPETVVRV